MVIFNNRQHDIDTPVISNDHNNNLLQAPSLKNLACVVPVLRSLMIQVFDIIIVLVLRSLMIHVSEI